MTALLTVNVDIDFASLAALLLLKSIFRVFILHPYYLLHFPKKMHSCSATFSYHLIAAPQQCQSEDESISLLPLTSLYPINFPDFCLFWCMAGKMNVSEAGCTEHLHQLLSVNTINCCNASFSCWIELDILISISCSNVCCSAILKIVFVVVVTWRYYDLYVFHSCGHFLALLQSLDQFSYFWDLEAYVTAIAFVELVEMDFSSIVDWGMLDSEFSWITWEVWAGSISHTSVGSCFLPVIVFGFCEQYRSWSAFSLGTIACSFFHSFSYTYFVIGKWSTFFIFSLLLL